MAGVQRIRLCELNINIRNGLIVGIIIAKGSVRSFTGRGKNAENRGVTSFTLRDSEVDFINCDVWGSEYFAHTFYERFLVGDTVEISSPKICVKQGDKNELYRPQVSSPFFLSLNEGVSDVCIYSGEEVSLLMRLLHVPTKPPSGYHQLAELLKITESENVFVDLLAVVKSIEPVKNIKTKAGVDMRVRSVELMDNTTPATVQLDIFDNDTIQRASEWSAHESVLFVADARVSWRWRACRVTATSRTVITHNPHTPDAETLRLNAHNMARAHNACGAAAWAAWDAEGGGAATVAQVRDRLASPTPTPFTLTLHALVTHLDLEPLCQHNAAVTGQDGGSTELRIRLADHTGELSARIDARVLEEPLGCSWTELSGMGRDELAAVRWRVLLERCSARLAAFPPGLSVLALRLSSAHDPAPLY